MRQTIREIEVNIAYRWFIGYSFTEKIPHFSTFNKNYERRFKILIYLITYSLKS
ncbi:transposase [Clostridium septicum]|uniref:transposase n=1 Tax=Clostridium septicum TaxID=1504 RepID=UPI0026900C2A